jgi:hypothetical protein
LGEAGVGVRHGSRFIPRHGAEALGLDQQSGAAPPAEPRAGGNQSQAQMTNFPDAISVLSAMITPAVLISACGSLILATSDRLSKAVARTREISSALVPRAADLGTEDREEERRMLFTQLDFVTTRSRLLQRALSRLYAALAFFVGTSVAIGLVAITSSKFTVVPIALGLFGAGLLLYVAFLLIKESRFALAAVNEEMDFVWKRGKEYGPPDLVEKGIKRARWFGGVK